MSLKIQFLSCDEQEFEAVFNIDHVLTSAGRLRDNESQNWIGVVDD